MHLPFFKYLPVRLTSKLPPGNILLLGFSSPPAIINLVGKTQGPTDLSEKLLRQSGPSACSLIPPPAWFIPKAWALVITGSRPSLLEFTIILPRKNIETRPATFRNMPIFPLLFKTAGPPSASPFQSSMSRPIISNLLKLNTTLPSHGVLHP